MGSFSNPLVDEKELLKIARFVCGYSPGNILLIGGGCVLSETAGYKRMRSLSDDLDFIVNDAGLQAVQEPLNLVDTYRNGRLCDSGNITYINDILVGFFHKEIRGWNIPESIFQIPRVKQTSEGEIYMIPAELNLALKIRRGASQRNNPHIYGKDALDAATIFLGAQGRESLDRSTLLSYLTNGVCSDCNLSRCGECVSNLKRSRKQLCGRERVRYDEFMDSCSSSLESVCPKPAFA